MRHDRGVIAAGIVLVALLLMGCIPAGILSEFAGGIEEKDEAPAAKTGAEPVAAKPGAEHETTDVSGRWVGELTFSDFTMHVTDEQTQLVFANEIAESLDKPYTIILDAQPDQNAATLNFDGSIVLPGAMSRTGDEMTFEFRQAGTGTLEVGATLPVAFTLTGSVTGGPGPLMSGNVTYDVFTMDGAPAWTQVGTWSVTRN